MTEEIGEIGNGLNKCMRGCFRSMNITLENGMSIWQNIRNRKMKGGMLWFKWEWSSLKEWIRTIWRKSECWKWNWLHWISIRSYLGSRSRFRVGSNILRVIKGWLEETKQQWTIILILICSHSHNSRFSFNRAIISSIRWWRMMSL